ncbi:type IV secretion protein Rhs [Lysobacter maris]|uniref:Type IV secretion protein Rhs n=2 Tax=Marilutibacter maris TaxID=1605891 RepID=A0A2U9T8E8_9GAMM|nr:type IV secretion protein Rhs [Lysobacter maris]
MVVAYQPRLTRIQERSADGVLTGYWIAFEYSESTGRLTRAVASDGRQVTYGHDEFEGATRGNLRTVAGLDDYVQGFAYTDPVDPHRLTAIVKNEGAAPVVNTYNAAGQVIRQVEGGSTFELDYSTPGRNVTTEIVTDASGAELQRRVRTREFDEAGYLTRKVDAAGHEERYIYNAGKDRIRTETWEKQADGSLVLLKAVDNTYNGQAQKLTESVTLASGEVVTATWTYDHGWIASEQKASTASPQVFRTEYEFVRDAQGVPINIAAVKRRNDDGSFATTSYSYCSASEAAAPGSTCPDTALLKTVDGPRTDVSDLTTYVYYGTTDVSGCGSASGPCQRRGDLKQVTNALGQSMDYLRYDGAGRAVQVRDANGVITDMVYHPRGWLLEQAVRGPDDAVTTDDAITSYQYDSRGNVISQTRPDGSFLEFEYDDRDRLTVTRDPDGNEVRYTLDSIGNRWKEETFAADGTRVRTLSREFDMLDRIARQLDAQNHTTVLVYDGRGRQTQITDALGRRAEQSYDALDRLKQSITDADGLQVGTSFHYDAAGNLRQVVDPKGLATSYQYDALGQLLQLDSPDTGTTIYTYDPAGNHNSQTDARGETSTYGHDALNRLSSVSYSDSSLDAAYAYDSVQPGCATGETFAIGRLSRMSDGSGHTDYCYDRFGQLVRKIQVTNGQSFTLRYAYTQAGQLSLMTYPDGTEVDYVRDGQGRTSEIGVTAPGGSREVLLSNASWYPSGPVGAWTFGNGRTLSRTLDLDYRPQSILSTDTGSPTSGGGLDLGFRFDAVGNLTSLHGADRADPPRVRLDYDALSRLTAFRDGPTDTAIESYGYDATGNRTSFTNAGGTQAYSYPTDSHRLGAVAGVARGYDAVGNTTAIGGTKEYVYSAANRLSAVKQGGAVTMHYGYNGSGERVHRHLGSDVTYSVYDEAGHWVGDYDASGAPKQQAIWLDDLPVGLLNGIAATANRLHYIEPDHLGTPRAVIEPQRDVAVWTWDIASEAFGNSAPNQDPDGDSTAFTLDMRFPGQRYDAASGLNYNYFRDYEAGTGRYSQSDPIGLLGGIGTYNYALAQPVQVHDRLGLNPATIGTAVVLGAIQGCAGGCAGAIVGDYTSCVIEKRRAGGKNLGQCSDECTPNPCDALRSCVSGCIAGAVLGGVTAGQGVALSPVAGYLLRNYFRFLFSPDFCQKYGIPAPPDPIPLPLPDWLRNL